MPVHPMDIGLKMFYSILTMLNDVTNIVSLFIYIFNQSNKN
jgi:hypothetical protein